MDIDKKPKRLLCPSYQCTEGAQLIGVVRTDGKVHFVEKSITINKEFVQVASEGSPPEQRFRFAHNCAQESCQNWSGNHCMVAAVVAQELPVDGEELPNCSIRSLCRWYSEWGSGICAKCPNIVRGTKN